jgi:hypothetical protein
MKRLLVAVFAALALASCQTNLINEPGDGLIVAPGSVMTVTGQIPNNMTSGGTLTVNGIPTSVGGDRKWTQSVPVGPVGSVTVVEAIYTEPGGKVNKQRQAVVVGDKINAGDFTPNGVGMMFTANGLANLGPVINQLAGGSFDISALILSKHPLIPPTDAGAGTTMTGDGYEAGAEGVTLSTTPTAAGMKTHIEVKNLYLGIDAQLSGLVSGNCKLEVNVPTVAIDATFDLAPSAGGGEQVDVNMVGAPVVTIPTVNYEFISGICDGDTFIIGSIINSLADSQIKGTVAGSFVDQVKDPDGAGPADSPIADAIETALGEISISGAVGGAIKAHLNAPFTSITESPAGIDFRANADFYTTPGASPADCAAVPGAPQLPNTYDLPTPYVAPGGTTPSGSPYGLGLVISASAFNQMLGAMTECGLLNQDIHEISLGGGPLTPITSSLLAFLVPQFATKLPANTPMFIRVDPVFSPFLSGNAGPSGERAELKLADLHISFVQPNSPVGDLTWLTIGVDAPLGFDMGYDSVNKVLAPTITQPPAGVTTVRVISNAVGANEPSFEALFAGLFPQFVSSLGAGFGAFPLPAFLGMNLDVLELGTTPDRKVYTLYANLTQSPQTHIENVVHTDLSEADHATDSCCFNSYEWRHRNRKKIGTNTVRVDLKAVVGDDACCSVDDSEESGHAGGRVTFNVVPAPGAGWTVNLNHLINGSLTTVHEGYRARATISTVTGRYRIGGGSWVNFNFNPSVMDTGSRGSTASTAFTGSRAVSFSGTGTQAIEVEFGFDVQAISDSSVIFPVADGDEAAVRIGANDSLANGFTAGDYPGVGNRNILNDGYTLNIAVS